MLTVSYIHPNKDTNMKKYTLTIKHKKRTIRKTVTAISELDAVIKATANLPLSIDIINIR